MWMDGWIIHSLSLRKSPKDFCMMEHRKKDTFVHSITAELGQVSVFSLPPLSLFLSLCFRFLWVNANCRSTGQSTEKSLSPSADNGIQFADEEAVSTFSISLWSELQSELLTFGFLVCLCKLSDLRRLFKASYNLLSSTWQRLDASLFELLYAS